MSQTIFVQNLRPNGVSSALAVAAAKVIKPGPGMLASIMCIGAGDITIGDSATTAGVGTGNYLLPATYAMTAGQLVVLSMPCLSGISVSAATGTFNIFFT